MDMTWLSLHVLCLAFLTVLQETVGNVEVILPYYPLYIEAGESLVLPCNSQQRLGLEWVRMTPSTSWRDQVIVPTVGSDFLIRNLTEEPTGYREITLTKKNVELRDRGQYTCRDVRRENTFPIYVTVLKISKTPNFRPNQDVNYFLLSCNISGFTTNVPDMQYQWSFNNQSIPRTLAKYIYGISEEGRINLNVTNPVQSDSGVYECSFILNTEPVTFSITQQIYVDGRALVSGGDTIRLLISTQTCLLLLVLLKIYIHVL